MYIVISGYVAKGGGDLNPHRAARSLVYLWVPLVLITGLIRVRSWGMAVLEGGGVAHGRLRHARTCGEGAGVAAADGRRHLVPHAAAA